jgi:hypothetical protein
MFGPPAGLLDEGPAISPENNPSLFCQNHQPGSRCIHKPGDRCDDIPCLNITGEYSDPDQDPEEDP